MNKREALRKAKQLWGVNGIVWKPAHIPGSHDVGAVLAGPPAPMKLLCGWGDSWEAAFRCATRRGYTGRGYHRKQVALLKKMKKV